jgi:hypothetical protein
MILGSPDVANRQAIAIAIENKLVTLFSDLSAGLRERHGHALKFRLSRPSSIITAPRVECNFRHVRTRIGGPRRSSLSMKRCYRRILVIVVINIAR